MAAGGFDAVIGNPPYVRIQTMKEWAPLEVEHYKKQYVSASKGNYDIYVVFVERGLSLLNKNGLLGYILPHKFFTAQYGEPLRTLISQGKHLREVVHFGHQQIFSGATTYTCLLFLGKIPSDNFYVSLVDDIEAWKNSPTARSGELPAQAASTSDWNFVVGPEYSLFEKIRKLDFKLKEIAHIFVGTQTSAEDIFVLKNCRTLDGNVIGYSEADQGEIAVEKGIVKSFLKGRHIRRYTPPITDFGLICPYEIESDRFRLYNKDELASRFPLTFDYLKNIKNFSQVGKKGNLRERIGGLMDIQKA
jgi:hypothetical protein